jgi:hypothetical protein
MMQLKLEIVRSACGFWRDGSPMIMEDVNIGKLMRFPRIKTKIENRQRKK